MPSSRPLLWSVLQYVTFKSRLTHPFKTPMGALSVVICAILSSIFLKEKLTFFGWLGCSLCIVCPVPFSFTSHLHPSIQIGSVIIALNGMSLPDSSSPVPNPVARAPRTNPFRDIRIQTALHRARLSRLRQCTHRHRTKHHHLFRSKVRPSSSPPPPLTPSSVRYGKNNMIWYITVCSTIGGISVSVTTGLGAAIVTTVMGYNQVCTFKHLVMILPSRHAQFNNWFIFFLLGFVVVTLCACLPVSPIHSTLTLRSDRGVLFKRRACAIQYRCAFHPFACIYAYP